ncbi:MAG: hypothetical protein LQ344_008139 [Seirophora lacunosa]|nr:MAG: hypothetical protein LQ344_008139 [Seirophora lacunosa]
MVSNTSAVTCYSLNKISAADSPHSKDDADQLVACNPGSVNSTCCYAWETCAPDLLCYNSGAYAAGTGLTACADGSYCCGADNFKCCSKGAGTKIDRSNGQLLPKSQSTRSPVPSATVTEPSGSSSSAADNASSSTTAPAGIAAANPSPSPSSNNGGPLIAGAKAGIAIGCVAAAALVAVLLFLLRRERRKRKSLLLQKDETAGAGHNSQPKWHEGGPEGIFQQQVPVQEMSAPPIQELGAHQIQELNAHQIQELTAHERQGGQGGRRGGFRAE